MGKRIKPGLILERKQLTSKTKKTIKVERYYYDYIQNCRLR